MSATIRAPSGFEVDVSPDQLTHAPEVAAVGVVETHHDPHAVTFESHGVGA